MYKKKVLVVGSEHWRVFAFKEDLEDAGFTAIGITDSRQALNIFTSHDIDLIITDLEMPHFSGRSFCKLVHKFSPKTPVIVLTDNPNVRHVKHSAAMFEIYFDPNIVISLICKYIHIQAKEWSTFDSTKAIAKKGVYVANHLELFPRLYAITMAFIGLSGMGCAWLF